MLSDECGSKKKTNPIALTWRRKSWIFPSNRPNNFTKEIGLME